MAENLSVEHTFSLIDRARLNLTGVREVRAFDEETLLLDTVAGRLTVKGEQLKISAFHRETGDFCAEGKFHAFAYASKTKNRGLSALFR